MEPTDITEENTYLEKWHWYYSTAIILATINAILGLVTLEWAWYNTRRYRQPI